MSNEESFGDKVRGLLAKVVGGAMALIAIGAVSAVRHAGDIGKAAVETGMHAAPSVIERSAASSGDDLWRAGRSAAVASSDRNGLPLGQDTAHAAHVFSVAAEQSDSPVAARAERRAVEEENHPTFAEHAAEFTGEVAQEAAENVAQECAENIMDKDAPNAGEARICP